MSVFRILSKVLGGALSRLGSSRENIVLLKTLVKTLKEAEELKIRGGITTTQGSNEPPNPNPTGSGS